jgi:Na+/melibiose symporter-like transporter
LSKLGVQTKLAYGIGQIGEQVKTRGFDLFVFFYFNQVLGLEGWMTGLAVAIALVFDAVTDPLVGSLSDHWDSPLGRRHPFMYAASVPLGIFWTLLFFPPTGLGEWGLFGWLTLFAILVRGAMTLYHVPHLALGAEMTTDYEERTSVVAYRTMFGMLGGVFTTVVGLKVFFPDNPEYGNPLLAAEGYPRVAIFGAIVMVVTIWYSAFGTRQLIPSLPKAPEQDGGFSLKHVVDEFREAWSNPSFRALFVGFSLFALNFGVTNTLSTHINVFFWEFTPDDIAAVTLVFVPGFAFGALLAQPMHRLIDKKATLIVTCLVSTFFGNLALVLRLLGLLPSNDSPLLLPVIAGFLLIVSVMAALGFISAGSMMADVAMEHELSSGSPRQGIFLSATSFSGKLASGGGHLLAGLGISLIAFPARARDAASVDPELIRSLALLNLCASAITLIAIWSYTRYAISRERYAEILSALDER